MISIAMATFNGERFLEAQLGSLAAQQRLPGELIICDDASTDGTLAIVQRFAATAPFPVRIEPSESNNGSTAAFERAIRLTSGSVIALCDQDDLWTPTKLERIHQALEAEPRAAFVFSDADLIDERGQAMGRRLWSSVGFTPREQRRFGFASLLRRNVVTGAALAFRRDERLLPIPHGWLHDAWIALVLTSRAPGVMLEESLIRYRQHAGQQIGATRRRWREQYAAAAKLSQETLRLQVELFEQLQERLKAIEETTFESRKHLEEKIAHLQFRRELRTHSRGRWRKVMHEWRRYAQYSRGLASMLQDLWFE